MHRGTGPRWWRLLALLCVVGLLAAACGGDDGGGGEEDGEGTEEQTQPEGDPDEGATPVRGGSLTFAREAETSSPWTPSAMVCDTSCHVAIRGIYDTLTVRNEEGEATPFLLESFEANDDYTEWTLVTREGITFHDDTPFDADAVVDNLERMRTSLLAGTALTDVETIEAVDDRTVVVTMSRPWTTFPNYLGAQTGYVASPTWLAAVDAGEASEAEPVGTGPFVFEEYRSGASFRMVRNPDYWLEAPDGEPYPYLDEIEFLVQEEDEVRERALLSGDIDVTHTEKGAAIENLREAVEAGSIGMYEHDERSSVTYALLNVGAPESALNDVRIRRAWAHAADQEFRNESRSNGVFEIANGPFSPGTTGYLEDNGWPEHDPEEAARLVEEYEAENGPVVISFKTTADPDNLLTAQLISQDLEEAGIEVEIDQIEQGEFIVDALQGEFEAFTWRGHGGINPEGERVWWIGENAEEIGALGLNFGRMQDEVIDENLNILRESTDEAEIAEAAEAINRRFAEQVYNVWADWVVWTIPYQNDVHGVWTPLQLPDGSGGRTQGLAGGAGGTVSLHQLWVD